MDDISLLTDQIDIVTVALFKKYTGLEQICCQSKPCGPVRPFNAGRQKPAIQLNGRAFNDATAMDGSFCWYYMQCITTQRVI
jgi:hypothetical protein